MKMRVLISSTKGKMRSLGELLTEKYDCKIDVIPPAYSCDKERLVIVGASVKDDLPNPLELFAKEMTKLRAQNVALFLEGNKAGADKLTALLKEAGTNVVDDIYWVKSGSILSIFKGISAEEKESLYAWSEKVMSSLV